jgi:hypothetical protein
MTYVNCTTTAPVNSYAELDAFMQMSSDKWTARTNNWVVALWLAPGDSMRT